MQVEEINWDCLKFIEIIEVSADKVQGIWDEENEMLESAVAM